MVGILIHFGQGHDSKEGGKTIEAIPVNGVGVMNRGFAFNQRITELLESSDKDFVLRVKNNISLGILENGKCKLEKDKRQI